MLRNDPEESTFFIMISIDSLQKPTPSRRLSPLQLSLRCQLSLRLAKVTLMLLYPPNKQISFAALIITEARKINLHRFPTQRHVTNATKITDISIFAN